MSGCVCVCLWGRKGKQEKASFQGEGRTGKPALRLENRKDLAYITGAKLGNHREGERERGHRSSRRGERREKGMVDAHSRGMWQPHRQGSGCQSRRCPLQGRSSAGRQQMHTAGSTEAPRSREVQKLGIQETC